MDIISKRRWGKVRRSVSCFTAPLLRLPMDARMTSRFFRSPGSNSFWWTLSALFKPIDHLRRRRPLTTGHGQWFLRFPTVVDAVELVQEGLSRCPALFLPFPYISRGDRRSKKWTGTTLPRSGSARTEYVPVRFYLTKAIRSDKGG